MIKALNPEFIGQYVTLKTDVSDNNAEYGGIVASFSDMFVVLLSVNVWQSDGIYIFPGSRLHSMRCSEIHRYKAKILDWNEVKYTGQYDWVALDNYNRLLLSIQANEEIVCVRIDDVILVGSIENVGSEFVKLKLISPLGSWLEKCVEVPFEDILHVRVGAEFGNVFQQYADAHCGSK